MYGVLLILVLIITGGAIAFIGDHLGTKVGKKRLSILGLRPKHTSMLVTVITGILITATTLGVMAVASENVRTALFGMEKLNQEMAAAKQAVEEATADLIKAKAEQQAADLALSEVKLDLEKLQKQQIDLEIKAQALQLGNEELERAKQELLARYDVLSDANDRLLLSQKELTALNNKMHNENLELEQRNQELRDGIQIMREGEIAFRAGEVLAVGEVKGKGSADSTREAIQNIIDKAQENALHHLAQRVDTEITEQDTQVWIYQPEYDAAVEKIASTEGEMIVRIVAAGNLLRGEGIRISFEIYRNDIVYQPDELILAKNISLDGSPRGTEQALLSFLQEVNDAAIKKGMIPDPLSGAVGVIEGEQIYNVLMQLQPLKGTTTLSAYAKERTDVLGPLRISFKLGN